MVSPLAIHQWFTNEMLLAFPSLQICAGTLQGVWRIADKWLEYIAAPFPCTSAYSSFLPHLEKAKQFQGTLQAFSALCVTWTLTGTMLK